MTGHKRCDPLGRIERGTSPNLGDAHLPKRPRRSQDLITLGLVVSAGLTLPEPSCNNWFKEYGNYH